MTRTLLYCLTLTVLLRWELAAQEQDLAPPAPAVATPPVGDAEITNPAYLIDLAQVHLVHNALPRSENLARRAIELLKGKDERLRSRAIQLLANVYERKKDLSAAAAQYEEVVKAAQTSPERVNALMALSSLRERNKEIDQALRHLDEAATLAATAPDRQSLQWVQREVNRRCLDILRRDPERLDTAIVALEKARSTDPNDDTARDRLAEIYSSTTRQDPAKALPLLEEIAASRPDVVSVQQRLAALYSKTQQPEKALEIYRKLQASGPKDQQTNFAFQASQQLVQMGRKDDAIKLMSESIGATPVKDQDASMLATIYEQAGQQEQAEVMLKKAAELATRPAEKGNLLVRAAEFARRRKDYSGAETQLRAALADYKDHSGVVNYAKTILTQVYRDQGKEKELRFEP
jgi:tetratricopeptide (TPR) repeat protein